MTGPNAPQEAEEEQPLDPATERVRRKLVRFMGINLAILFAAVMAVVVALVYKSLNTGEQAAPPPVASSVPSGEVLAGNITLPAGASIVSHSLSSDKLTLHLQFADGREAIHLYDIYGARPIGRFEVTRGEQ